MAQTIRIKRRVMGMLGKRLREAGLDEVDDPRDRRGRRWSLGALLRSVVVAMIAGCSSLKHLECMTAALAPAVRARLGIFRRVPDTTLRDALCQLEPAELRPSLHAVVKSAHRRKALEHDQLPFGVVSLDGKATAVPSADDFYAQRQTRDELSSLCGVVRTITTALTSSRARPVIDVNTIAASTNEMGSFRRALAELCSAYQGLDLFRLVTYDAGACSKDNADAVREHGLHYLFGLKNTQPTLHEEAVRWLGSAAPEQAAASSSDFDHGRNVVRRLYLGQATAAPEGWDHLRTVLRVETETLDERGQSINREDRYFVSSLPRSRLTPDQWLLVVRRHWGVETAHQILDIAFDEDDHPWIEQNPRATAVLIVLRRIAYTLLALWKYVTLRSDEQRSRSWTELMREIWLTLVTATAEHLHALSLHRLPPAPA